MAHKFNVGDKVRVKKDLVIGECYPCNNPSCSSSVRAAIGMDEYFGKVYTIEEVGDLCGNYHLEGCGYLWFSDAMVEAVSFTKADLKDGMVVETKGEVAGRNRYLVLGDRLIQRMGCFELYNFTDDLVRCAGSIDDRYYDIVKVYKSSAKTLERIFADDCLELIWERETEEPCKEMTVEEIEKILGHKVKVVGDKND